MYCRSGLMSSNVKWTFRIILRAPDMKSILRPDIRTHAFSQSSRTVAMILHQISVARREPARRFDHVGSAAALAVLGTFGTDLGHVAFVHPTPCLVEHR